MSLILTAEAKRETEPGLSDDRQVKNVDFLIVSNMAGQLTGDGVNEKTFWVFDFSQHSDFPIFDPDGQLRAAILTLDLEPKSTAVNTDTVRIHGLDGIHQFAGLRLGEVSTVKIDLIGEYKSHEILQAMCGLWLPMQYEEDAIIRRAHLLLEQ